MGIMHRRRFLVSALALGLMASVSSPALALSRESDAIREALRIAARLATERLGRRDGYFGDAAVRINLPRSVSRIQSQLRPLGLAGPLDNIERKVNRAAEASMPAAGRIFREAIQSISIRDAISIVRGGDNAATDYLRYRTGDQLGRELTPSMENALSSSGVYSALDSAEPHVNRGRSFLNQFGLGGGGSSESLRDSVTQHAVDKAIDGVFYYIAREESAIRRDPIRRTTRLLRRVFG
jgi:hypothetical protein